MVEIKNLSGETLVEINDADLRYADLRYANLRYANLNGAYLREADLSYADLSYADLSYADLRCASLRNANLRDAYLRCASLISASLRNANLRDASLNWNSHELLSEVLRQNAGEDIEKRKIAGLLLVCTDWCWEDFLKFEDPLKDWALGVFKTYLKKGETVKW